MPSFPASWRAFVLVIDIDAKFDVKLPDIEYCAEARAAFCANTILVLSYPSIPLCWLFAWLCNWQMTFRMPNLGTPPPPPFATPISNVEQFICL